MMGKWAHNKWYCSQLDGSRDRRFKEVDFGSRQRSYQYQDAINDRSRFSSIVLRTRMNCCPLSVDAKTKYSHYTNTQYHMVPHLYASLRVIPKTCGVFNCHWSQGKVKDTFGREIIIDLSGMLENRYSNPDRFHMWGHWILWLLWGYIL